MRPGIEYLAGSAGSEEGLFWGKFINIGIYSEETEEILENSLLREILRLTCLKIPMSGDSEIESFLGRQQRHFAVWERLLVQKWQ